MSALSVFKESQRLSVSEKSCRIAKTTNIRFIEYLNHQFKGTNEITNFEITGGQTQTSTAFQVDMCRTI